MKSFKEWYSAKELEGIEGLPNLATNITRKALKENWLKRDSVGIRGGGYEYHYSSLPLSTQIALGVSDNLDKVEQQDIDIRERIKRVIGAYTSKQQAIITAGISDSLLKQYIEGTVKPTFTALANLAIGVGASLEWLATGKGEMFINVDEEQSTVYIDGFSSIKVSAGFGSFNEGVTKSDCRIPYPDYLIQKLQINPKKAAVFWTNGNSMYPTIKNSDQLLVDLSKNSIRGDDKVYIIQNQDSVWVKRIRLDWSGITLISDNQEEYKPIFISREEAETLQIIGQVVHIGHSLV